MSTTFEDTTGDEGDGGSEIPGGRTAMLTELLGDPAVKPPRAGDPRQPVAAIRRVSTAAVRAASIATTGNRPAMTAQTWPVSSADDDVR